MTQSKTQTHIVQKLRILSTVDRKTKDVTMKGIFCSFRACSREVRSKERKHERTGAEGEQKSIEVMQESRREKLHFCIHYWKSHFQIQPLKTTTSEVSKHETKSLQVLQLAFLFDSVY